MRTEARPCDRLKIVIGFPPNQLNQGALVAERKSSGSAFLFYLLTLMLHFLSLNDRCKQRENRYWFARAKCQLIPHLGMHGRPVGCT
jgi:hypothetical protein